nr:TetR/AcrR family transcriptional regulator [Corynebacterium aurimucosum]
MSNVVNKKRGRPLRKSHAREEIITAARKSFTEQGYKATTLREIARNAGVNHSLVNYCFGQKENLFNESLLDGFSPAAVFKRERDTPGITVSNLPQLLAHPFVAFCEPPPFQRTMVNTLRLAFEDQETKSLVTDYVEHEIFHEAENSYRSSAHDHPAPYPPVPTKQL